jgi:hypothetical protein
MRNIAYCTLSPDEGSGTSFRNVTTGNVEDIRQTKGKVFPSGGPEGCGTSRLPHFLDNRPTDGSEVVSLTQRPPFIPRKIPGTNFC